MCWGGEFSAGTLWIFQPELTHKLKVAAHGSKTAHMFAPWATARNGACLDSRSLRYVQSRLNTRQCMSRKP